MMIIDEKQIAGMYEEKLGYTRNFVGGAMTLWKSENGIGKLIIISDSCKWGNKESAKILRNQALAFYNSITPENTLVILLGGKGNIRQHGNNQINVDIDHSKCHSCIKDTFSEEKAVFENFCRETKDLNSYQRYCAYGSEKQKYSLGFLFFLIALNSYIFAKTTDASLWGVSTNSVFLEKESYRLVTYMFVHKNVFHLISNMVSLYIWGKDYVRRQGSMNLFALYIFGGIMAAITSMVFNCYVMNEMERFTIGASGAIFAIMGGVVADNICSGKKERAKFLLVYAVFTILSSAGVGVDNACHIGGFLAGAGAGYIIAVTEELYQTKQFLRLARRKVN